MFSDNIGDQAIADAMFEFSKLDENTRVDRTDFSFRTSLPQPSSNSTIKNTDRTWKYYVPSSIKKIFFLVKNFKKAKQLSSNKYDLAIIGGGQLILGGGVFPYSLFLYTYFLKRQSTKLKIVSAGVGGEFTKVERYLIRKSLNRVDSVYLRDKVSINNLKIIFGKESQFSPDIVYYFYKNKSAVNPSDSKRFKLLICPVEFGVHERYASELRSSGVGLVEYKNLWVGLIREGLSINNSICISATTIQDSLFTSELRNMLTVEEQKKIEFKVCLSYQEFIELVKEYSEVLSGRMHALILCHNLGLKITPFEISKKLQTYKDEYLNKEAKEFNEMLRAMQNEILK